jgi:hypothetical protein
MITSFLAKSDRISWFVMVMVFTLKGATIGKMVGVGAMSKNLYGANIQ